MNLLGDVSQSYGRHDSFLQLFEILSHRTVLSNRNITGDTGASHVWNLKFTPRSHKEKKSLKNQVKLIL